MKKRKMAIAALMLSVAVLSCACGTEKTEDTKSEKKAETESVTTPEAETSEEDSNEAEPEAEAPDTEIATDDNVLADGVYEAEFETDSSMFHVNEANNDKGILTVKDGKMEIHISLVSKNIVNLYPGLAEEAQMDDAVLLQPTVDEVTYSDGTTEEVYGFDVPVPAIDEEFDLALIGTKGKWYDHRVYVTNPVPEETAE